MSTVTPTTKPGPTTTTTKHAQFYKVEYWCSNCNNFFKREFIVGGAAPGLTVCPRCEVFGAEKAWKQLFPLPMTPPQPDRYDDAPWIFRAPPRPAKPMCSYFGKD